MDSSTYRPVMLYGMLALLGAAACAADGVLVETESALTTEATTTSQTTDTQTGSVGGTGPVPVGWPQDWHGDYYEDPGVALGLEHPGQVITWLRNYRLEERKVTFVYFGYEIGSERSEWTLSTELDRDILHILPPDGEWNILFPGAETVLLRPGAGCDDVALEAHGLPPPYDPVFSLRWQRGSLCVTDPYDDSIPNDKWMVDLCPGSVSSCGDG